MIATAKTYKPGIYRQMPDAEYRAIDALSHSNLMAWPQGGSSDIDPAIADFGSAYHAIIGEPEVAKEKIVGLGPGEKRKDHADPDKWVLTNSNYKKLMGCYESAMSHPDYSRLVKYARSNRDRCELVLIWVDPLTELLCKLRLDCYTDDWLYDYKTTGSDPDSFGKSIGAFMYHCQAAHYLEGAKACGLEVRGFRFAPVCKRPDKGHVAWIQDIPEAMLCAGIKTRQMLMNLYKTYYTENSNDT